MKYKTSEAIAMLEKNPSLRFKNYDDILYASEYGYIMFERKGYSKACPAGRFEGNVNLNTKWELIQQPVSFMEAVKAYSEGKTIRCERHGARFKFNPFGVPSYLSSFVTEGGASLSCIDVLEGTWYVEDSYENH
jgi:hypothetical protein